MGKSQPQSHDERPAAGRLEWLTRWAIYIALAIMLTRGTLLETLRDAFDAMPGAEAAARGPGPASGLVFDLLAMLPALVVLLRRVLDRTFSLRFDWSHAAGGLLALWTAASVCWSSDRFAAVIGAAHFVAAIAALWAVSQAVRNWKDFRLVTAIGVGLLVANLAHGLAYRYIERPDLIEFTRAQGDKIIRERGLEPGSFDAEQLLRKAERGEQLSFFTSSNTLAAMLVLLGFITIGAAIHRMRHDDAATGVALLLLLGPAALLIVFCQSKTALATPLAGGVLLGAIALLGRRGWLQHHARSLYFAGVALVVVGALAVVGHGISRGSLPGASLNFRWHYWVGSARMVVGNPIAGVGYANFGPSYLAHRLPVASEEIRDPHNLFVRSVTELGLVGAGLMLVWLALLWWRMTRPVVPIPPADPILLPVAGPPDFGGLWPLAIPAIIAGVLGTIAGVDFAINDVPYITLEVFRRFLYSCLIFLGAAGAALRLRPVAKVDSRPAPWVLYATLVGLGLFFIHNLIDFSFYETGALFVVCTLAGAILGLRGEDRPRTGGRAIAFGGLAAAAVVWLTVAFALAVPVAAAERAAQSSEDLMRRELPLAALDALRDARRFVPYNAAYALREARLLAITAAPFEEIDAAAAQAIAHDPMLIAAYVLRAENAGRAAQGKEDAARWRERAIKDYQHVLKLDPASVALRMDYARLLEAGGDVAGAARQLEAALTYSRALEPANLKRNDLRVLKALAEMFERAGRKAQARHTWEEALAYDRGLAADDERRLSPAHVAEIEKKIAALSSAATAPPVP